ncbi:hypothetical protein LUZ60_006151 [Juncus effusus]|nr:hypothetical protein LUZ60_006151 [Juncus effusus]
MVVPSPLEYGLLEPDSVTLLMTEDHNQSSSSHHPLLLFFKDARLTFKWDELGKEIAEIALPAALALAADPIASLVDTAFIGQIGPVELAAVGVAIAVFNQVSRICIFPLVSVTTSFVAEEDATYKTLSNSDDDFELEQGITTTTIQQEDENEEDIEKLFNSDISVSKNFEAERERGRERKHIPSVSAALVVGGVLGLIQAVFLVLAAKPVLTFMGIKRDEEMMTPASRYLTLRSLGAPAVLLSLAMQGVFRGLKDTKTPLYATVAGDATNIVLDPMLIFVFKMGVSGAAIAHVISQYLIAIILLKRLLYHVDVLPPNLKDLQFGRFLKNGFLLLMRVIAVTFCVTLSASMAAREGAIQMAAFQICLQVWLASSLLADGLAVAGQAIIASAFARNDSAKASAAAARVLQLGVVLGLVLCAMLGLGFQFASHLFTKDVGVLHLIYTGIPFVALTQPLNSLAFVFDGINYGSSDFAYSAYSMIFVAVISITCVLVLSSFYGFVGIWVALTIYMSLRMLAGFLRIGTASGPWTFLRTSS